VATAQVTRPNRALDLVLLVALAGLAIAGFVIARPPSAPAATVRTTSVVRGTVLSSVQASGNVQAGQTYSVNFQTGGQITDIDVQVGQSVTKGEALAHLDPSIDAANLASANASLQAAQARVVQLEEVETPQQRAADAAALAAVQQQASAAQTSLNQAQQSASTDAQQLQQALNDANTKLQGDTTAKAPASQISQDQSALAQAQNAQTTGVAKDQQAVTQAQNQLSQAQLQVTSTVAQNNVKEEPPQVGDLSTAQAAVTQAQAQVESAQQTMGWTTLVAPASGVVTGINGVVGQAVSGGGLTATAGSTTASAGTGSTGSSGAGATGSSGGGSTGSSGAGGGSGGTTASASSSSSSASAGTTFITITNLDSLTVKAGFAETDATKLQVGQPAVVTFNALPNLQAAATVTEVDVNSTLVSNVVTYFATVALTNTPAGVKPGMTASVTVTVGKREGVLTLPSAAVRGNGTTGTVTTMDGTAQRAETVSVGLRGDTSVEITSGLNVGDTVVLPSSTVSGISSQLTTGAFRGLGGFAGLGGGGARLGGGGGGGGFGGGGGGGGLGGRGGG